MGRNVKLSDNWFIKFWYRFAHFHCYGFRRECYGVVSTFTGDRSRSESEVHRRN